MPKYRYANSNGQILPSKQLKNAQITTQETFSALDAYNLRYSFSTGALGAPGSFVVEQKSIGYAAFKDSLLGWWRIIPTDFGKHLPDSSGRGNAATPPSG